jgi:hypothetical protein
MPLQRLHCAYPGEHRWPVMFCDQDLRHRGLPFFGVALCLGQFVKYCEA